MPAKASLVLTDRAATPVNHTFTPQGVEGDAGGRYSKAAAATLGDFIFTVNPRVTPNGRRKIDLKLSLPVLQTETINGISSYKVVRASRVVVTCDFASDSTEQERKDTIGMIYTALAAATTQVNDVLTKGENLW